MSTENTTHEEIKSKNFLELIIEEDIKSEKYGGRVHTRFPPEPNGYLHIGHAKSICLNFGLAQKYNGLTNLRFDDTNPVKEDTEYVDSIMEDVRWLGFDWGDRLFYASDYFDQLYLWAEQLIMDGKAYVDDQSAEDISQGRGTVQKAGIESPFRNRSVEENLKLFREMREGKFKEGEKVLRAKIDMAHPNMHMRDPILYRILFAHHHRTGNKWCIYPMYDYAHGESDSIEGITHSICTLEFEIHRPLYDWFTENLNIYKPRQYEFARLNLTYTVMSKRKLLQLVKENLVLGWDDPRMPTISGLRRRGYTPESIRNFCERIGVAKRDNTIDVGLLEFCLREDLNKRAERRFAILSPVKLIIDNYPENQTEELDAINNPENPELGSRKLRFGKELYIERDDFMENPPKGYFRLAPGGEVRLKYGYIVKCESIVKDSEGNVTEIHCTYDPESKAGMANSGRKIKGTIHWLSADTAKSAKIRLFDRLFTKESPEEVAEGESFLDNINQDSLKIVEGYIEPSLTEFKPFSPIQFERIGYFCADYDSTAEMPIFNRSVTLKDSWKKS